MEKTEFNNLMEEFFAVTPDTAWSMAECKLNKFNGRLYKYFGFSSPYSLLNIENDTVYLNNPKAFNDPFDCCLGYSKDSIYRQICLSLILEPKIGLDARQLEAFTKFIEGERLEEGELHFLLYAINAYAPECNELEVVEFLSLPVKEKLKIMCKLIGLSAESYPHFIDMGEKMAELRDNVRDTIDRNYKITCFSQTADNELMWAHYADKHTGFCVEYDFSKMNYSDIDQITNIVELFPVYYTKNRPLVPIVVQPNGEFNYRVREGEYTQRYKLEALLTKSIAWQYENEWRLVKIEPTQPLVKLPIISKIYAGVNISKENYGKLETIAKKKEVPLIRRRLHDDKYEFINK